LNPASSTFGLVKILQRACTRSSPSSLEILTHTTLTWGMRGKGITYDTGFLSAGTSTHEPFDPEVVRREMRIIHEDLHCNAVRVTGGYVDRLKITATYAAEAGLEVWLCPFTNGFTQSELLDLLADCADHAERLRRSGCAGAARRWCC
jgi:hypothetical protein